MRIERKKPWLVRLSLFAVSFTSLIAVSQAGDRGWLAQVPPEARQRINPIPLSAESVSKGREVYTNTCATCHGTRGMGNGPAAEYLVPPPKPLHKSGRLVLPDGVIAWLIFHGIEDTAMVSMREVLEENDRWHVINYMKAMARHYGKRRKVKKSKPSNGLNEIPSQASSTPESSSSNGLTEAPSQASPTPESSSSNGLTEAPSQASPTPESSPSNGLTEAPSPTPLLPQR